jgi:hypothetical protein
MFKQLAGLAGVLMMATVLAQAADKTKWDNDNPWHRTLIASGKEGGSVKLTCHLQRKPLPGETRDPWPSLGGQEVTLTMKWGYPIGPITYPQGNEKVITDGNGVATFIVPIPPGVKHTKHDGNVSYEGKRGVYLGAGKTASITVTK